MDGALFIAYERKRFRDGSNSWVHKFVYNMLNIDLIRITDSSQAKVKYLEMGVEGMDEQLQPIENQPTDGKEDLPF
jgi:hypothetical protein